MSDPKRLNRDESFGASLLRTARGDTPSSKARARAATALGVSAGALTATSAAAAHVTALKIVALSVVALGVTAGATHVLTQSDPPPPPTPVVATTPAPRGRVDEIPRVPTLAEPSFAEPVTSSAEPISSSSAAPVASAPPVMVAASTERAAPAPIVNASPAPTPSSDLVREVRALDQAKSALNAGDAPTALTALDRYDHDFPQGALQTEAEVLRVDALLAAGNQPAAKRLASAILARDPASAHARHLRSILDAN